jgi:hypothetical protein
MCYNEPLTARYMITGTDQFFFIELYVLSYANMTVYWLILKCDFLIFQSLFPSCALF